MREVTAYEAIDGSLHTTATAAQDRDREVASERESLLRRIEDLKAEHATKIELVSRDVVRALWHFSPADISPAANPLLLHQIRDWTREDAVAALRAARTRLKTPA